LSTAKSPKPLTGRKVLAIGLSAFGVIFAANMALVYAAIGSFPGLEVKNSYVASQSFDTELSAQLGLGWTVLPSYDGKTLVIEIRDADGNPAKLGRLDVSVGRATTAANDVKLDFGEMRGPFAAPLALSGGKWEIRLAAVSADGTAFKQRLPLYVK
jgi:nitrogen fixation protein FixH